MTSRLATAPRHGITEKNHGEDTWNISVGHLTWKNMENYFRKMVKILLLIFVGEFEQYIKSLQIGIVLLFWGEFGLHIIIVQ